MFSVQELTKMKTIRTGAYGQLKVESDREKVWFNPKTKEVTVEEYVDGYDNAFWDVTEEYKAN